MSWPASGENVKLGKGALFLGRIVSGVSAALDFLGNANSVSINSEPTNVQLFSSTERSGALISESNLRTLYTLTASLNEFTRENLLLWFKGEENEKAQAASTGRTVLISNVVKGKYYELGARQVTNAVLMVGTDTLVSGTDYTLDSDSGMFKVLPGSTVINDDGTDDIEATFEQPALTIKQIRLNRESSQECRLLFLADDANQSGVAAKDRLEVWRVNVAPEGELNLISDDYGAFSLTMTVMDDSANHPDDPYGTLDRIES